LVKDRIKLPTFVSFNIFMTKKDILTKEGIASWKSFGAASVFK
jgi:hypothetical protein